MLLIGYWHRESSNAFVITGFGKYPKRAWLNMSGSKVAVVFEMQSYRVREKIKNKILEAAEKMDRAFQVGTYAIRVKCESTTLSGYLPTLFSEIYPEFARAAKAVDGDYEVVEAKADKYSGSLIDIGDIH